MPSAALRALLAELIDYAGLFPPAGLPMSDVAANYDAYRASPDRWALGRLIVPAFRLPELLNIVDPLDTRTGAWPVSVLMGDDIGADLRAIIDANARGERRIAIDTIELKAATPTAIDAALAQVGDSRTVYVEIPVLDDPHPLLHRIRHAGARAKIRTGGITRDVFPAAAHVARFISACASHDVPFKATAGLHHPVRGDYPLTYAPHAPRGAMFGFLNVFLAAAFARAGMPAAKLVELLDEQDMAAMHIDDTSVRWSGEVLTTDVITDARQRFAIAFGSCSFREPIDDLHRLALL